MNLTWHIVKKDFRRLWLPLALLVLLTGLQVLLGAAMFAGDGMSDWHFRELGTYQGTLWGAQVLLTYVLAGWLAQEDPARNTRAFWPTRPIARRQLLGAKVLGALLMLMVPAILLTFPWWVACGFRGETLAEAVVMLGASQAALMVVAFAVAACTESWTQFAMVSFVLAIAGEAGRFMFSTGYNLGWRDMSGMPLFSLLAAIRPLPVCAFLIVCSLVCCQYFGLNIRQLLRVLGLGVAGTLASVLVWTLWPERGIRQEPSLPPATLSIEIKSAELQRQRHTWVDFQYAQFPRNFLEIDMLARDIVAGYTLEKGRSSFQLSWTDGVSVTRRGYFGTTSEGMRLRINAVGNLLGLGKGQPESVSAHGVLKMTPALAEKIIKQSPAWNATLTGQLWRPHIVMKLPLQPGAQAMDGAQRLQVRRIYNAFNDPGRTNVVFAQSNPVPRDRWDGPPIFPQSSSTIYYIVGGDGVVRECGNIASGNTNADINGVEERWFGVGWSSSVRPGDSESVRHGVSFGMNATGTARNDYPVDGNAVLYKIVFLPEKSFLLQLAGDKFPLSKVVDEP